MPILNLQLGKNNTSSEAILVEGKIMPEDCCFAHDFELLDQLVDTFMALAYTAPDSKHLWILIMDHASRNLDIDRVFTNIAIIRLNSLSGIKHVLQSISKANDIRPVATREWSHQPNNPASQNADTNLIPEPMSIELVCVPRLWNSLLIWNRNIRPVD